MTVKDFGEETYKGQMAKRQKTEQPQPHAGQSKNDKEDKLPSEEMLGVLIAATRTPDLNIVEFSDTISDVDIMPEQEPLSDSELPPRPERRKKKNHSKEKRKEEPSKDKMEYVVTDKPGTSSSNTSS